MNMPRGVFDILGNWDRILRTDEKPESNRDHRNDIGRISRHVIRLVNLDAGSHAESADQSHEEHGTKQQIGNKILDLGEHVNAL